MQEKVAQSNGAPVQTRPNAQVIFITAGNRHRALFYVQLPAACLLDTISWDIHVECRRMTELFLFAFVLWVVFFFVSLFVFAFFWFSIFCANF